jgi:hypothetical protein
VAIDMIGTALSSAPVKVDPEAAERLRRNLRNARPQRVR